MANIKISELKEYTQAKDNDLLVIVDTTNNETKKIQAGNLGTGGVDIPIQDTAPTNPKSGDFYVDTADNSILKYYQNEKWNDTNITGDTLPIGAIVEYDGTTVPTGYEEISEMSGSNANGNWIKLADGTIIEYGNGDCSLDPNSYRDVIFTLPVKTLSTIWANVTMQSASASPTMGSITFAVNTFNTTSITVRAFNNTNDGRGPSVYWIVIGRWK